MIQTPDRVAASDRVGVSTLERMASAPAYNRWMYDRLCRWIGANVLEVGSGIGNMSQFFVDRDTVVLTDTEDYYRKHLHTRFGQKPNVTIREMVLPEVPDELRAGEFDTVVCLNVLEHIEQDVDSLRALHELLIPGGLLVLLVPALPSIYGTLDTALGHFRRYTPALLRSRYSEVGLKMHHLEYFNTPGIAGWWFTGKILKREIIPTGALGLYDMLVPLFRLERFLPVRVGQSLIAIGEKTR